MTTTELPATVPCTRAHLNNGVPCGDCRICRLAVEDPGHGIAWGSMESPEPVINRGTRPSMMRLGGSKPPGGPGTELKAIFKAARCKACPGCLKTAAKMDQWGPTKCDENLDVLVVEIQENKEYKPCFPNVFTFIREEWNLSKELVVDSPSEWLPKVVKEAIKRAYHKQVFNRYSKDTECFIGPSEPHKYCSKYNPIDRGELKRSIFFHIWPFEPIGSQRWRWNIEQLGKRRELFNGRIVVGIATGGEQVASEKAVRAEVARHIGECEIIVRENDPELWEGATFGHFLETLDTTDPNEITLLSHAKGVTRPESEAVDMWCDLCWKLSCDYPDIITEQLENFPITGSFRKTGGFESLDNNRNWHYSGSFCWFRNSSLVGRDYTKIEDHWGSLETWPGKHFAYCEAGTVFLSGGPTSAMNLYALDYWKETVWPSMWQWLSEIQ